MPRVPERGAGDGGDGGVGNKGEACCHYMDMPRRLMPHKEVGEAERAQEDHQTKDDERAGNRHGEQAEAKLDVAVHQRRADEHPRHAGHQGQNQHTHQNPLHPLGTLYMQAQLPLCRCLFPPSSHNRVGCWAWSRALRL